MAPPGHSLAQKKNIPLEEIANESLIVSNKHISFDFDFKGKYDLDAEEEPVVPTE